MLWFLSTKGQTGRTEALEAYRSISEAHGDLQGCEEYKWDFDVEHFEDLGHIEVLRLNGDLKIWTNPPHVARLPKKNVEESRVCLCGFRSPDLSPLLDSLGFSVDLQPQKPGVLPLRRHLSGSDAEVEFAVNQLRQQFSSFLRLTPFDSDDSAAWQIGNFGYSARDILSRLSWGSALPPTSHYQRKFYNPKTYGQSDHISGDNDFFLSFEPVEHGTKRTYLWRKISQGWERSLIGSRWGRILAMRSQADQEFEILRYDEENRLFAIPKYVPLPWPFGRALCLCSGFVRQPCDIAGESGEWVAYSDIPRSIAQLISRKLGQSKLTEGDIKIWSPK
jgi:hypothetical protein